MRRLIVLSALLVALPAAAQEARPRTWANPVDVDYRCSFEQTHRGVSTPADQAESAPGHHSPLFRIDPRPSVTTGVEATVVAAQALMPKG